jgi:hypothetical protein
VETPEEETEYIEFVGSAPHGTEFIDTRVISVADAKNGWDLDIPEDLRWDKKNKGGKPRMLLEASKVPADVRELLLEDKSFKVVRK